MLEAEVIVINGIFDSVTITSKQQGCSNIFTIPHLDVAKTERNNLNDFFKIAIFN